MLSESKQKLNSLFANLWSQSEFRTQQKSQQKTDPKSLFVTLKLCSFVTTLCNKIVANVMKLYEQMGNAYWHKIR